MYSDGSRCHRFMCHSEYRSMNTERVIYAIGCISHGEIREPVWEICCASRSSIMLIFGRAILDENMSILYTIRQLVVMRRQLRVHLHPSHAKNANKLRRSHNFFLATHKCARRSTSTSSIRLEYHQVNFYSNSTIFAPRASNTESQMSHNIVWHIFSHLRHIRNSERHNANRIQHGTYLFIYALISPLPLRSDAQTIKPNK